MQLNPTLPPVDYSFQFAPLTRVGSNPSQLNRFWMAILSQAKPVQREQNECNHQEIIVF